MTSTLAAVIAVTSLTATTTTVDAATYRQAVSDTYTIYFKFPDKGMKGDIWQNIVDGGGEAITPDERDIPHHTGWSGRAYSCRFKYGQIQVGRDKKEQQTEDTYTIPASGSVADGTYVPPTYGVPYSPKQWKNTQLLSQNQFFGTQFVSKDYFLTKGEDPSPTNPIVPPSLGYFIYGPEKKVIDNQITGTSGTRTIYNKWLLDEDTEHAWVAPPLPFGGTYNTTDSHRDYPAYHFKPEIDGQYGTARSREGETIYEVAVRLGARFTYDGSTPIPPEFKNSSDKYVREANAGKTTGSYTHTVIDSRDDNRDCNQNDKGFQYYNNDFYVGSTITLHYNYEQTPLGEPRPKGEVEGQAYWELERTNPNRESDIVFNLKFKGTSTHVGVRNTKLEVKANGSPVYTCNQSNSTVIKDGSAPELTCQATKSNAISFKDKDLTYKYSYEFTNKDIGWSCENKGYLSNCPYNNDPDWRAVELKEISDSLKLDHSQFDIIKDETLDNVISNQFVVGRKKVHEGTNTVNASVFHEYFTRPSTNTTPTSFYLDTQGHLPLRQGALTYDISVPSEKTQNASYSPFRKELSNGFYLTKDMDESLQGTYANTQTDTIYTDSGYGYAIPIQQSIYQNTQRARNGAKYNLDWISDVFAVGATTGYIDGVDYAKQVHTSKVNGSSLPSASQAATNAVNKAKQSYKTTYGYDSIETFINRNEYAQEYYIPVSNESIYEPNTQYKNHIVYTKMGVSDVTFRFDQAFEFKHYLVGSAKDKAWIVEQSESRQSLKNKDIEPYQIYIKNANLKPIANQAIARDKERIHGLRYVDLQFNHNNQIQMTQ